MNKRMEDEIGENIIKKQGHKWKLSAALGKILLLHDENGKKLCARIIRAQVVKSG